MKNVLKHRTSYLMMLPYLLFFAVFTLLPVILSAVLSFTDYDMVQPPVFVGLDNYLRMFLDDEIFILSFSNTLLFALILGPASYVICFMTAWLINELKPLMRSILTAMFYIPAIVGAAGWGVWRLLFSPDEYGFINSLLISTGIINEPMGWLVDGKYILVVLIIVQIWLSMGISFLAFIAGLQTIDRSLYEAGVVDGIHNRFQELWYITIPSMAPQMIFGAVMQIIAAFTVADVSIELAGFPSTNYAGETIVTHIMDYGNLRYEFGYACAMATVLVILMQYMKKLTLSLLSRVGR